MYSLIRRVCGRVESRSVDSLRDSTISGATHQFQPPALYLPRHLVLIAKSSLRSTLTLHWDLLPSSASPSWRCSMRVASWDHDDGDGDGDRWYTEVRYECDS